MPTRRTKNYRRKTLSVEPKFLLSSILGNVYDDDNDDVDDDDNVCLCSGGADKETTTTRSGPWHGSFLILSLEMICKDMHIYLQYNDVCITNFKEDIFLQISREMYENYKKESLSRTDASSV